ncbi:MAG TPA: 2-phospho-L-lactate guanylyltransferase [Solirubrobacteraceae bacterium]
MRTAAILPIKRFSAAKQRLGASVEDPLHAQLVRAMVGDVLRALAGTPGIELTIAVTNEPVAIATARAFDALIVADRDEAGQSAAVELGITRALEEGFERVLCVPGDCPALEADELAELLEQGVPGPPGVVVVPDRHGTGTNGLLLQPPDAIAASFGPDSCARHLALAREAGVQARVEPGVASLLLDVDTGADLSALRDRLAGEHSGAPGTRVLLDGDTAASAAA